MAKLVVMIMGQDCKKFMRMSLTSVLGADHIIYCDGGSTDGTVEFVKAFSKPQISNRENYESYVEVIQNPYNQQDKEMNGKQRNFYLEHLKKNYMGWWCLAIDADEVVENLASLRSWCEIAEATVPDCKLWSVHMRHFISDLGHEDSTVKRHYVPHRLFKVEQELFYPLGEHPILSTTSKTVQTDNCDGTTIWHLAYIPNLWEYKKRYDNHMKKSEIHTPSFLKRWYHSHVFGAYPREEVDPSEIPPVILNEFGINPDEIYFRNRGLELKHWLDAMVWKDHFKAKSVIEFGCGLGVRVLCLNYLGMDTKGVEISKYAVDNTVQKNSVIQGDVTETKKYFDNKADLVLAYDVLEHIDYDKLGAAIQTLIANSNSKILVSVPFLGDPNLEKDKTHKIKQARTWWVQQFLNAGCKELPVPQHFYFKEQLLIFEVPDGRA